MAESNVATPLSNKQFMDGLGRPVMSQRSNGDGTFTKSYVTYDALGRQDRSYEPIVNSTDGVDINYLNFTTGVLSAKAFTYVQYEKSPLSRPERQYNLDGSFTAMAYGTNTASDVLKFTVASTAVNLDDAITPNTTFDANSLSKTTMWNENGAKLLATAPDTKVGRTDIFKDKLGRVVLTRKYLGTAEVNTYNVYDDYGQLVMVIPPDALTTGNAPIANLVFCYKYDNQNRLARKQVPGAGWQKFYYDNRDLLTLTQDGNMRAESNDRYLATQYDDLGRVVRTGWATTADPTTYAKSGFTITDADALTKTEYYPGKSWVKHQAAKVLKPAGVSTLRDWIWNYTEYRTGVSENTGYPVWSGRQHLLNTTNGAANNPITDNDTEGVDWQLSDLNGAGKPKAAVRYLFTTAGATAVRTFQTYTHDPLLRLTQEDYSYGMNGAGFGNNGAGKPKAAVRYLFTTAGATAVRTFQTYTYDKLLRLTQDDYSYGMNGVGFGNNITLSNMVYNNNRDQLIEKTLVKGRVVNICSPLITATIREVG